MMHMQLELEFACRTDSDSEVELWNDQEDEVDIELELSDADLFHVDEAIQDENWQTTPSILSSTFGNEDEDDSGPDAAELGSSEDENDLRYVLHILGKYVDDQSLANRDETLECLEDFVLSFLTKLSDALPGAYSRSESQPVNQNKIILQLADRRKESHDEHVRCCRMDT